MEIGRFITFEGGEGSGKSTQLKHLARRLEEAGIFLVTTREPGGTPYAEEVRDLLLSGKTKEQGPDAEAILVSSARRDHISKLIKPALKAGQWVLCDRFIDSTLAYQGILEGGDIHFIANLNSEVTQDCSPDLTLVLDVSAETAMDRVKARGASTGADRFDNQTLEKYDILRRAFVAISRDQPNRCVVVDGEQEEDGIASEVWDIVQKRFALKRAASGSVS